MAYYRGTTDSRREGERKAAQAAYKEKKFLREDKAAMKQADQGGFAIPILGGFQCVTGLTPEQIGLTSFFGPRFDQEVGQGSS